MIKAVIFDFDDTLVESRLAKWAQHRHVAREFYNIDLKEETLLEHWGKPLHNLIEELYERSDTLENMMTAVISTRDAFPKKPYMESVNIVKKLLSADIKVGILSAATRRFIIEDLKKFGFPVEQFFMIQGASETLVHKPNPDVFTPLIEALKKEDIDKEEIVYVGDSLYDLKAATQAGLYFIAITTGLYSRDDFEKNGAKVIVQDIKEVANKIL